MNETALPAPCEIKPLALKRWNPGIRAASEEEHSISIYDAIGQDPWSGEGVTTKRIAAALRSVNGADVTVNINSPGGDMFEGLAIYNLLRDYSGKVTVKVLGLAASAASIIAMAGDEIRIARAGFLNIHNCWVVALGNRQDLLEVASRLEPFDQAMAEIYASRTQSQLSAMQQLMDADTWLNGSAAVEQGFADQLLAADAVRQGPVDQSRFKTLQSPPADMSQALADFQQAMTQFKTAAATSLGSLHHV
ncbi:Clp protease ClpP [Pseudomonas sp. FSL R10-0056]|uniref:head maturation protease, ClpP-related n=1 Tax=unclassified Pseudomonas TaxID=196821 RepID=UPI001297B9CD|nr:MULTISPECIES: head maturation protease, ClpP-related [unclassified Pseudomonas]MQT64369.1 Clp protease ClpP [Pseudomonas sp. FSL R10-0056]MQT69194.1 Clp protease ClpP [Pseudomonas sp. FSL R10-0071]MQU48749.1 Clp protease ClpP [Pseudomonas sp. FSL A6-1183]